MGASLLIGDREAGLRFCLDRFSFSTRTARFDRSRILQINVQGRSSFAWRDSSRMISVTGNASTTP